MSDLNIVAVRCDCPPGECEAFWGEDDKGLCVNRLDGDVRVMACPNCAPAQTWHHNGVCLSCQYKGRKEAK